jgi:hypothetical protein
VVAKREHHATATAPIGSLPVTMTETWKWFVRMRKLPRSKSRIPFVFHVQTSCSSHHYYKEAYQPTAWGSYIYHFSRHAVSNYDDGHTSDSQRQKRLRGCLLALGVNIDAMLGTADRMLFAKLLMHDEELGRDPPSGYTSSTLRSDAFSLHFPYCLCFVRYLQSLVDSQLSIP